MIAGELFTRDFLREGVTEDSAWAAQSDEFIRGAWSDIETLLRRHAALARANEAETEHELIFPVLRKLGWPHILPQQNLSRTGRRDVPDALLFVDDASYTRAAGARQAERFRHGAAVLESKRWALPLDGHSVGHEGVPSTQMLHYLRRVEDITEGSLPWGVLTNGRRWRLYFQRAMSVAEDFLEIDLGKVFALPGVEPDLFDEREIDPQQAFRLFLLLFARDAFVPTDAGRTLHERALDAGRTWQARIASNLSDKVFRQVFPELARSLAENDPQRPYPMHGAYIDEVRRGALILLYRLLFVLYAEDRDLLPDEAGPYAAYSLTRMRWELEHSEALDALPAESAILWARLSTVFGAIARGNDRLGVPPYNGGLFTAAETPILERSRPDDRALGRAIHALSFAPSPRGPRYISYRDLTVQQLGSIYERILEFGLRAGNDGRLEVAADAEERRDSGSYYTPEALVSLVVEKTLGPLVEERLRAFRARAEQVGRSRRAPDERAADLAALDAAEAMLELKVCDPAMGSGHFLVSLVDWLTDRVLDALEEGARLGQEFGYVSPVRIRAAVVRQRILEQAQAHGWPVNPARLEERHVVRRMILKRVVYGVDKNPMAVELAKVSLWLHSFTVGAPLSFLDHSLRAGDSVVGAWLGPTLRTVEETGSSLLNRGQVARISQVAAGEMAHIGTITDSDLAAVADSKDRFASLSESMGDLPAFLSLMTARRWIDGLEPAREPTRPRETPFALKRAGAPVRAVQRAEKQQAAFDRRAGWKAFLSENYGDPLAVAAGRLVFAPPLPEEDDSQALLPGDWDEGERQKRDAAGVVERARVIAAESSFLHWELAFPHVWNNLASGAPAGGFDAVIGNPPYVRQELIAPLKPALTGYRVYNGAADLFVYFYEQGLRLLRPGGRLGYVVTNKWLRAGYAEELRALFADQTVAEVEFLADFGHAKRFFPDADVFPSVLVVKKPEPGAAAPDEFAVAVIPRDEVPEKGLEAAVAAATFRMPRAAFTREAWALEPPPVMALLAKIRDRGIPLAEYAAVRPIYGIKTGLNEAFLVDTPTRNRLVHDDPGCAEIIKPYLRGQDIQRWSSPPSGLHMILLKSSGDHSWPWKGLPEDEAEAKFRETYPSLHARMKGFESLPAKDGVRRGLRHREDQGRYWWELRPCSYYSKFARPKIIWQMIQYFPRYSRDVQGQLLNNKAYGLASTDDWLLGVLGSPLMWWVHWRHFAHMKDEALSNDGGKFETLPVAPPVSTTDSFPVPDIMRHTNEVRAARAMILDWLKLEFGLTAPKGKLLEPERLDPNAFAAAVRAQLGPRRPLSAAGLARLKAEYAETLIPAAEAAHEIIRLERVLSDSVNVAYGLVPEEIALMWRTAPPRMPLDQHNSPA